MLLRVLVRSTKLTLGHVNYIDFLRPHADRKSWKSLKNTENIEIMSAIYIVSYEYIYRNIYLNLNIIYLFYYFVNLCLYILLVII